MNHALRQLMEEHGFKQAELARKLHVTQSAVNQWLKKSSISTESLFEVAKLFKVDAEALSAGHIVRLHSKNFCVIPLLNEVQAGLMTDINQDAEIETLPVSTMYENCFALKIVGTSMTPQYREGDFVICDPNKQATSGDDVVAVIESDQKATFKRYRERSSPEGNIYFELYPLNDDFPTISSLTRNITIKGVKVALFRPN